MKLANLEEFRKKKLNNNLLDQLNTIIEKDLEEELSSEEEKILNQIGFLAQKFEGITYE